MIHHLGSTRSSLKPDHLLHTPDTFIRTPLSGSPGVEFIVHSAPRLGAGFAMFTAELTESGLVGPAPNGVERFLYVLEGQISVENPDSTVCKIMSTECFAYLPSNSPETIRAEGKSRVVVIEKLYQPPLSAGQSDGHPTVNPQRIFGRESEVDAEPLGGDDRLQVKHLMPDGPTWDFAVNTMTYEPGASLAMVEVHVMEHGLLMLEGGGIYRLGDSWYPVTAGDFIWMAPYCPQWFGAIGKTPAKYLIYKDWYRHPLDSTKATSR